MFNGNSRHLSSTYEESMPFSQIAMMGPQIDVAAENGAPHGKMFHDPIHGSIRMSPFAMKIIDTPQFQRLRDLKQLGLSYYVFPGASHNRFEHSLGVAFKAWEVVSRLKAYQGRELELTDQDVKVVELAGLCHDLGHGPFSHVFDHEFLPRSRVGASLAGWTHERMSGEILARAVEEASSGLPEGEAFSVSPQEVHRITEMITASHEAPGSKLPGPKPYLGEIVANGRNSIDVDKFDYLARDCYYCGVKASSDFQRLIQFQRVIGDEICYRSSEFNNIWDLFQTRASLHRRVYTHKKSKAIEYMVVDALLMADDALRISDKIWNPDDFVTLDDTILKAIEWANPSQIAASPSLGQARDLIRRIRKRDIYQYAGEMTLPQERWAQIKAVTPEMVSTCNVSTDYQLRPEDIIIHNLRIDYTMKEKNPLEYVSFYDANNYNKSFGIKTDKMSTMFPREFMERKIRIFTRSSDPKVVAAAQLAFTEWQRREFGGDLQAHATPVKDRGRKRQRSPLGEVLDAARGAASHPASRAPSAGPSGLQGVEEGEEEEDPFTELPDEPAEPTLRAGFAAAGVLGVGGQSQSTVGMAGSGEGGGPEGQAGGGAGSAAGFGRPGSTSANRGLKF